MTSEEKKKNQTQNHGSQPVDRMWRGQGTVICKGSANPHGHQAQSADQTV